MQSSVHEVLFQQKTIDLLTSGTHGKRPHQVTFTSDSAGIIDSWNPGAEQLTGFLAMEVVGQHYSWLFIPDSPAPIPTPEEVADARRVEGECWCTHRDGGKFWASHVVGAVFDPEGSRLGLVFVLRTRAVDGTERDRLIDLVLESIVDYAIYTIDREGIITSWNPGAQRAKGYARAEIVGENFSQFFTEDDRRSGKPARILAIAAAEGRFEEEGWRVRQDGTRFWANVVLDPIRDRHGEIIGFVKITRDNTHKRTLEATREQLYQAQKMEAVGQLTGGVAHDFNNMLTAINGSLELISANFSDELVVWRLLATARNAVRKGSKLIDQLLAFSRKQTLRPETSQVNHLILKIEDLIRRAIGDAIELQLKMDNQGGLAFLDPAQFQSAIMNLTLNARDAMPDGGTLRISTGNIMVTPSEAASGNEISDGPYVFVKVEDTGAGMAPDVQARAIEPFYTTKDVGKGSGLGLSQVYGFVRQSHGRISIETRPGIGTSVTLLLPQEARRAVGLPEATDSPKSSIGTVLVVEDDADVLDIAVAAVRSFGYEVFYAENAYQALDVLKRQQSIDVLFTDVVLPKGMSGVELAREARRLQPSIGVLFASGYSRHALPEQNELEKNTDFIGKPYLLAALEARLRQFIDRASDYVQQGGLG